MLYEVITYPDISHPACKFFSLSFNFGTRVVSAYLNACTGFLYPESIVYSCPPRKCTPWIIVFGNKFVVICRTADIKIIPFQRINRITSYNVCYTKLLRGSETFYPVVNLFLRIWSVQTWINSFVIALNHSFYVFSRACTAFDFKDTYTGFNNFINKTYGCQIFGRHKILVINFYLSSGFLVCQQIRPATVLQTWTRITSYNVCYTKLLRDSASLPLTCKLRGTPWVPTTRKAPDCAGASLSPRPCCCSPAARPNRCRTSSARSRTCSARTSRRP